ncbi:hypothetical protein N9903_01200, partial [bacterium]|nr:hypothetical protein [bacterium]
TDWGTWQATTQSGTGYTVTGLTDGQEYAFAVKAADSATTPNADANETTFTATPTGDTTPPNAVTISQATGGTNYGEVDLIWTAGFDDGDTGTATYYDIRYNTVAIDAANWDASTQVVGEPSPGTESMTVTGLTGGDTYFFAIKAGDEVPNWSAVSSSPSAVAKSDTFPPTFGAITATDAATDGAVNLGWAPAIDAEGSDPITYYISWSGGSTGNTTTTNGSGYTVTSLNNGVACTFDVYAQDSAGNPSGTQQNTATPTLPTPAPGVQTPLRLDVMTFTNTPGNWTGVPGDFTDVGDGNVASVPNKNLTDTATLDDTKTASGSIDQVRLYLNNVEGNTIWATVGVTNCQFRNAGTDFCDLGAVLTDWPSILSGVQVVLEGRANNQTHSVDMMYLEVLYTPSGTIDPPDPFTVITPPTLQSGTVTLEWNAPVDNDPANLTYSVYGSDDGSTYDFVVATGLTRASVNCASSPPVVCDTTWDTVAAGIATSAQNDLVKFKVEANDNEGGVTSAMSNAFSVNNVPPADTTDPSVVTVSGAAAGGPGEIVLTWTAVGDDGPTGTADQYDIRYSTTEGGASTGTPAIGEPAPRVAGTNDETMTIGGLTGGATYWFAINVADEVLNWSGWSGEISALPGNANPIDFAVTAPTTAGGPYGGSLSITWEQNGDPDTDPVTYNVHGSLNGGGSYDYLIATGVSGGSASWDTAADSVALLAQETNVVVRVTALDGQGGSTVAVSQTVTVDNRDTTAPDVVTVFNAAAGGPGEIVLTWTAVGDDAAVGTADQYDIRYSQTPAGASTGTEANGEPAPRVAGSDDETMTIDGLTPGATYYFAINVADEVPNWSGWSGEASGDAGTAANSDPNPFAVTAPSGGSYSGSVPITWSQTGDPETAVTYDVHGSINGGSGGGTYDYLIATGLAEGAVCVASVCSASWDTVADSVALTAQETDVWVRVTALDGQGGSATAESAAASTVDNRDTTLPDTVTVFNAAAGGPGEIVLTWTAVGDDGDTGTADQYDIRYSTTPAGASTGTEANGEPAPRVAGTNDETMTIGGLTPGATYYFAINVADEAGNWSGWSGEASGDAGTAANANPTAFAVTAPTTAGGPYGGSLSITWEQNGDPDTNPVTYDVHGSLNGGGSYDYLIATGVSGGSTSWDTAADSVALTAQETNVVVRVTALDGQGGSAVAVSETVTVDNVPPADNTAPAAVGNLAAVTGGTGEIDLSWTSVGDDNNDAGTTAASYDIRYRTDTAVVEGNWATAFQLAGGPAPQVQNSTESMLVSGLTEGQTYHFAIKVDDEVPNTSAISNSPNAAAGGSDTDPPTVDNVLVDTVAIPQGTASVTLTAEASDVASGNGNIVAAEYFCPACPGGVAVNPGNGTPMSADTPPFDDSPTESVTAVIDTSGWGPGVYNLFVDARDNSGNWGPPQSSTVTVTVNPRDEFIVESFNGLTESVANGAVDVMVKDLTFTASSGTVALLALEVTGTEDVGNEDEVYNNVAAVKIYRDDGNNTWDGPPTDELVGSGFLSAGSPSTAVVDISASNTTVTSGTPLHIYIAYDISVAARGGDQIDAQLSAVTDGASSNLTTTLPEPPTVTNIKTISGPVVDSDPPTVINVQVNPTSVQEGGIVSSIVLTAEASDLASNIVAAEYHVGGPGSVGEGTPMTAFDGAFDSASEPLTVTIDTSGWTQGSYPLHVDARDEAGNWSSTDFTPFSVTAKDNFTVDVTPEPIPPSVEQGTADVVMGRYTFTTTTGTVGISTMTILGTVSGTGGGDVAQDIAQVKIYEDNGNATFDGAPTDPLRGTGFLNATFKDVTIDVTGTTAVTGGGTDVFVVVDLSTSATVDDILGVSLTGVTYATNGNLTPDPLPLATGDIKTVTASGGPTFVCGDCHTIPPTSGAHDEHKDKDGGVLENDLSDCYYCHTDNAGGGGYGTSPSGTHNDGLPTFATDIADGVDVAAPNYTCTASCHVGDAGSNGWTSGTIECDACHYYAPEPDNAVNTGAGWALTGSHNAHFLTTLNTANSAPCANCHGTLPTNTAHITQDAGGGDADRLEKMAKALQDEASLADIAGGSLLEAGSYTENDPGNDTCSNAACHDPSNAAYSATWNSANAAGCAFCHV